MEWPVTLLRPLNLEGKIVIGEDMERRVIPYAQDRGADWYGPLTEIGSPESFIEQVAFINEKMDQGVTVYDIGPSPARAPPHGNYPLPTSDYYFLEAMHVYSRNGPSPTGRGTIPYEHLIRDWQD